MNFNARLALPVHPVFTYKKSNGSDEKSVKQKMVLKKTNKTNIIATNFVWEQLNKKNAPINKNVNWSFEVILRMIPFNYYPRLHDNLPNSFLSNSIIPNVDFDIFVQQFDCKLAVTMTRACVLTYSKDTLIPCLVVIVSYHAARAAEAWLWSLSMLKHTCNIDF